MPMESTDIDLLASDHSPCMPEMRQLESGDLLKAWAGIAGLQFNLPATWSDAGRAEANTSRALLDLARWWGAARAARAHAGSLKSLACSLLISGGSDP